MLVPRDHPLLIPEIILHSSFFADLKDAIAGAQVCKAWNDVFTSILWHTIDFQVQKRFVKLKTRTHKKHGHRIRVVKGVTTIHELMVLHNSGVCSLEMFIVTMALDARSPTYCFDLVRQNSATLTHLELSAWEETPEQPRPFFPIDSILQRTSDNDILKLTHLSLAHVTLCRGILSSFLRLCPALTSLNLKGTFIYSAPWSEIYQHLGLRRLNAPLSQVLRPDPSTSSGPSILAHFPRLESFHTSARGSSSTILAAVKDEIIKCCPRLKTLGINAPTIISAPLIAQGLRSLNSITLMFSQISTDVIVAVLSHKESLTTLYTYVPFKGYLEQDQVPVLNETTPAPGWAIQLIPQICSQITHLSFPTIEMDMDDIETKEWACTRLKALNIRIRGLNTKGKINRAIDLWRTHRKERDLIDPMDSDSSQTTLTSQSSQNNFTGISGNSIEERVARHLLSFDSLERVWLGLKVVNV